MTGIGFWVESVRSTAVRRAARSLTLALLAVCPLIAVNPDLSLGQYLHTSWTQEEGSALPPILALAQTADGYLWLATGKGLIRFDGMRFVEWSPVSGAPLPSPDIRCLRAASDGGLWVGTAAGVCRVDHNRVIRYPSADKLPCGLILTLLEDRLDACGCSMTVPVPLRWRFSRPTARCEPLGYRTDCRTSRCERSSRTVKATFG